MMSVWSADSTPPKSVANAREYHTAELLVNEPTGKHTSHIARLSLITYHIATVVMLVKSLSGCVFDAALYFASLASTRKVKRELVNYALVVGSLFPKLVVLDKTKMCVLFKP